MQNIIEYNTASQKYQLEKFNYRHDISSVGDSGFVFL